MSSLWTLGAMIYTTVWTYFQPTEATCVNSSDATYIQELVVRGQRERVSLAYIQYSP